MFNRCRSIVVVLLGILGATTVCAVSSVHAAAPAALAPGVVTHATFGVAFEHPQGWVAQMKDKHQTIGIWAAPGATPADPKALIQVEGAKPTSPTAEQTAQGLAKNFDSAVLKETTLLDGEKAWRVRAESHGPGLHPVEAVVAMHGSYVYLIMGGVTEGNHCQAEIERIRRSWKWIAWEPPVKHLALLKDPIVALGDTMRINVPELMRMNAHDDPDHVLDMSIPNLHRNAPDFLLLAQRVDRNPGQSFAQLKAGFIAGVAAKFKLNPAPTWRELPRQAGAPEAVIMPVIDMDGAAMGQPGKVHFTYALVELSAAHVVLVNFTLDVEAEQERKAYVPVMDQIIQSIRPVSEPAH